MSEARLLLQRYAEIRNRLRRPPNAVPDTGIDLKRKKEPPSPPEPKKILPEPPPRKWEEIKRRDITFSSTLEYTANEFGLSIKEIRERNRTKRVSLPRHVAVYLGHKHTKQSLAAMGKYLGMDHTTMIYARNKVKSLVESNEAIHSKVAAIEEKLFADFNRTSVPAISQPSFPHKADERGALQIVPVSSMDCGGRSTFLDPETGSGPDVEGQVPRPTRAIYG